MSTNDDVNRSNKSAKIAEIFLYASSAFSKLSELTLELNKQEDGKWTNEDINELKESLLNFGQNIDNLSQTINNRSKQQIRELIKNNIQQQQQHQEQNEKETNEIKITSSIEDNLLK
jgi:hypothetical protein